MDAETSRRIALPSTRQLYIARRTHASEAAERSHGGPGRIFWWRHSRSTGRSAGPQGNHLVRHGFTRDHARVRSRNRLQQYTVRAHGLEAHSLPRKVLPPGFFQHHGLSEWKLFNLWWAGFSRHASRSE